MVNDGTVKSCSKELEQNFTINIIFARQITPAANILMKNKKITSYIALLEQINKNICKRSR